MAYNFFCVYIYICIYVYIYIHTHTKHWKVENDPSSCYIPSIASGYVKALFLLTSYVVLDYDFE